MGSNLEFVPPPAKLLFHLSALKGHGLADRPIKPEGEDAASAEKAGSAQGRSVEQRSGILASLSAPVISALGALGSLSSGLASQTGIHAVLSLMAAPLAHPVCGELSQIALHNHW